MEYIKKYWWVGLLTLLLGIISWLAPSYRKAVKTIDSLQKTITWQDRKIKTKVKEKVIRIPIQLGERIVYRTERVTDTNVSEDTHSGTDTTLDVSTKETVETKRGQFEIGVGVNPLNLTDVGVYLGVNGVLGPLGAWGYTTLNYHALGAKIGL